MKRPHRGLALVATALAFLPEAAPAQAQKKAAQTPAPVVSAGLTANEAFTQARTLYNEKNYQGALDAYLGFKQDYGTSEDAKVATYNSLFPIAICFIQLNRYAEAIPAINEALAATPPNPQTQMTPAQIQDLTFWLGMANMQEKEYATAREALEKFITLFPADAEKNPLFVRQNPSAARLGEARSLVGTSWILDGKFREAADYYAQLKPKLSPDTRGRAVIFQLYALLELGDYDSAMQVVTEEYPRMADIPQLISFQTLTLKLGNHWLEQGEFRKTIICLQRVWTFERLVKHQEQRLAALESKLQAAQATAGGDPFSKILYSRIVNEVKRELENFRKVQNFDTALRFRLAIAYLQMKRYREAALIMENMINELPASPLTEQAALNVVRCWSALEDWPHTISSAQKFVELFPTSKLVPEVLFMKAEALQSNLRSEDAAIAFGHIAETFPDSTNAPRARFMRAFALLQAEKNTDSAKAFEDFLTRHPKDNLADSAAYWLAMTYSFDKQFDACREAMADYLAKNPNGRQRGAATFRIAYCAQQMERYTTAIDELHSYLENFPGEPENSEARVLLGNAFMNEGFMQDGIDVFKQIPTTDVKLHEEGVFRTAEALKLMEEYEAYRELMQGFVDRSPKSSRVAEAIGNLAWYHRQQEQPEKARDIHWKAIQLYGNDPAIRSVDDLFPSLSRLYRGPQDSMQYLALIRDMTTDAESKGQKTLQARLLCAQARIFQKSDPEQYRSLLVQAANLADVRTDSPALLVEIANALIASGREAAGEAMLRDALRWNPRAMQKDRILASLGDIELKRGNPKLALDYYTRFERENLGSAIFGATMLSKAKLHATRGETNEARRVFEAVLANESTKGDLKAEALYNIGELHMAEGNPTKAIPYYQRIYVMHTRWKPWVAKAYVRSGEAFEKIADTTSARRTYSELVDNSDLEEFPESATARARLQALGGPLPHSPLPTGTPAQDTPQAEPPPAQG